MNRKNKHTLIHLVLCTALFALAACTSDVDIENAGNNNSGIPVGTRLTLRATASDFNAPTPSGSDASTRTPVMEGTSTKFQPGDAIGLFCVRRPATGVDYISKDIYNLKMTYTEAADGTGSWEAPTVDSAPLVYTDAVTYFAYYPYKDALTTANVSNEQTIRDWLKANNTLPTDMLTLDVLAANDLMTATALPSHADDDRGALALNFKHEYALLVVRPMGTNCICVPPAGVTAYSYHPEAKSDGWGIDRNIVQEGGKDFKMKINSRKACEMTDGTYHILAEPTTTSSQINCDYVTIDYLTGMWPVTASGPSHSDGFKANTCYTLEVHCKDAIGSIERAIQPGDFVYQHNGKIEIYPGDGAVDGNGKIPDYTKAVGIVVTTAPARLTDAECNSQGWNHAYVMALEKTSSIGEKTPEVDETAVPHTDFDNCESNMNGYTETEAMLNAHSAELSSYPFLNEIYKYRNNNPIPNGVKRSPWFTPSSGQAFDIMVNLCGRSPRTFEYFKPDDNGFVTYKYGIEMMETLNNNHLIKVDKASTYTSLRLSSQYDKEKNWCLAWSDSQGLFLFGPRAKRYTGSTYSLQPFFAF